MLKQVTPIKQISEYLFSQIENRERALIRVLAHIGETCVTEARLNKTYKDRTGNLTSSMGYVLAKSGKVIELSAFEKVRDGADGARRGPEFARKLAREHSKGIALIVVAGMNYAVHVADLGYNVLDSAELLADKLIPRIMRQLGFKIG
jgi:hypothetical protein